jgi:hypothetical protein
VNFLKVAATLVAARKRADHHASNISRVSVTEKHEQGRGNSLGGEGRVTIENVGGQKGHEKEDDDEANQKISNHSSSEGDGIPCFLGSGKVREYTHCHSSLYI